MKKILLVISLFIVSCGDLSHEVSILDKSTCEFPCWNGIVVGETTEHDLLKILSDSPEIDQASIKNNRLSQSIFDNQIYFSFRQGWTLSQQPQLQGQVDITDSKVSTLIFCGKINTTMSRLIEEIGEPEHIITGNAIGGGRNVILIDSKNGVSYWFTADLSNLEIVPTTQIGCIHLFDSSIYETLLEIGAFSAGYYNAEETKRVWYEWDGYGDLDEKYPPRQP